MFIEHPHVYPHIHVYSRTQNRASVPRVREVRNHEDRSPLLGKQRKENNPGLLGVAKTESGEVKGERKKKGSGQPLCVKT